MANYISQLTPTTGGTYNIRELFPHIGTCETAASTAAKTVTIGNFKLYTGAWVVVKFVNTNTAAAASLTLNVDSTGAKAIKYKNTNLTNVDMLAANKYTYFMYDGTNYQIVEPDTSDTKVKQTPVGSTYTNYRPLLIGYANSATAGFSPTEVSEQSYVTSSIYAQPSSGSIYATEFVGKVTHPTIPGTGADTTSSVTPLHGQGFTTVDVVTRDSNGHVTGINTKTVTLPAQYVHPTYIDKTTADFYKIKITNGHISEATAIAKGDVSTFLNLLDTGSSTPVDADYYISQYVGGGTTTTSYHRRPMSALWSYVKGKADSVYLPIGHTYPLSIVADSGNSQLTLSANTKYKLTAGGSTFIFTTPTDNDAHVNVTLATTTKAYLLGTSTPPTATPQPVTSLADTGVYLDATAGGLCATNVKASTTVCANTANSNSAGGISLYGTDPETYGVMFRGTSNSGKHGYVQSDWATYFTMNSNAPTRGWIFRRKTDGTFASISAAGHAVFNGSVTVGGNSTNTSGCRMEYNSTTQTLDFVFA